jgi:putative transposase
LLVDTDGRVLDVWVSAADQTDRDGAKALLTACAKRFPTLKKLWADSGYSGKLVTWVKEQFDIDLEIVTRTDDRPGFVVEPRRWVVERTFGNLGRYRRLTRDCELLPQHSETMVKVAMSKILLNRLTATPATVASATSDLQN